jgi:beta-glucanase (GH16 family)
MRSLGLGVLAAILLTAGAAHAQQTGWPPTDRAAFIDRFEGRTLHRRWSLADGWHNGDLFSAEWRASQAQLTPEGVELVMAPAPIGAQKPYMSAELRTRETYLYGYFEARLRMPRGPGLVAAFFSFARPGDRETQNEIDVELLGRDPSIVELTYHVGNLATREIVTTGFDASLDFHTYAFEWRPDSIHWYLDNQLVHTSDEDQVRALVHPQRIELSLWNSDQLPRWLGSIDHAQAPWRMTVACVAYAPRYEGRSLCAE